MSVYAGPEISQSGLVFAYDMGNTNKSWKGAPATNLITNPTNEVIATANEFAIFADITPIFDTYGTGIYSISADIKSEVPGDITVYTASGAVEYNIGYYTAACERYYKRFYFNNINVAHTDPATTYSNLSFYGTYGTGRKPSIKNVQIEKNAFCTPFVNGTRSSTQAILDLTNISTVTVNGLNYTSDNYATINGTSSYIAITNSANLRPSSELTIEYIIKGPNEASWRPILGYGNGDYGNGNYLVWTEGGTLNSLCRINNGGTVTEYRQYPGVTISSTTYQQMTFTMKVGQSIRSYKNGVDTNTPTSLPAGGSFHYSGTTSPYQIGGLGSAWLVADVPFVRLYNRALTASEIQQNFNALRGRFGI
jgi:hypothetical protein